MGRSKVLVIDDEPRIRSIVSALLTDSGYEVQAVGSGAEGVQACRESMPMVVLLDLRMPGTTGLEVLKELNERLKVDAKTIILTGHGEVRSAVEAMKAGSFDYLEKPFDNDELLAAIARAVETVRLKRRVRELEEQLEEAYSFESIVGVSARMQSTFALMRRFAAADGTVLLSGESGTGKELAARAIHRASRRRDGPFVVVNCGAIPSSLIESEFFGHEAGAFTDAKHLRVGRFEAADGGILFLDEVGELTAEAQVKLLRVIEESTLTRVGSSEPIAVNVRVIAATNRDLADMVERGVFREDLYWRLNVLSLHLCPLRERKEDIPLLTEHFLEKYAPPSADVRPAVSDDAMQLLLSYDWPGNVRELQNCIYSALAVIDGPVVQRADLPDRIRAHSGDRVAPEPSPQGIPLAQIAGDASEKAERTAIQEALEKTHGNRQQAAELLGIGRKTLYRKLKLYGLS